ncbi:MAG: Inner membrane protein yjdF [Parcubacteria group bacterium GW2011_GWE2_39_37]|uniref:Inner membrane protein yjdF n=1 Tax=Candidatus Falkowbacteria bacterium GW2011_GWF2_39_8 TaxID=1618642 RepID=A0A0G0Q6P2_9BACT|nr:MAG: Inner membrane protein yjdF [Parcubacteria group bacterium GW2011_GWE2_39_37]KKR33011.1 MAG: Inner membrane protein yjdF [Candidatus Falkowbacteria bacterium GW2011_GWF2_39_8]
MIVKNRIHFFLALVLFFVFVWSAIKPHSYSTWWLEVTPLFIGLLILAVIYRYFKFTTFVYSFIFLQAITVLIGGHYTYSEMPLFDWLGEVLDLNRNHYDRFSHFLQGFGAALIIRELLVKKISIQQKNWLNIVSVMLVLAVGAFYELIEWWVAVIFGKEAEDFLGTQGDAWDAQWDMQLSFLGAIFAVVLLSRIHDKYLKKR